MSDITASTWWGSKNRYSTEEQIVGEWIDGKPIYQRVIETTTGTSGGWSTLYDLGNTCVVRDISFIYITVEGETCVIPSEGVSFSINDGSNGKISLNYNSTKYATKPCYFIVRYTKTTD